MRKRLAGWFGAAAIAMMTVACSQSDPGITTAVKSKLAADDTVKSYRIDVDTKDRVVTLTGAVDTAAARERAVQLARQTEGVSNVVDNLTVSPGATPTTGIDDPIQKEAREEANEAKEKSKDAAAKADDKTDNAQKKAGDAANRTGDVVTDAAITSAVKTKLLGDTTAPGMKIDVDTNNGTVTLTGTVANAAEKARALQLAKDTNGVKTVVDKIKVQK